MNNKQARDLGRAGGYNVEVGGGTDDADVAFLADFRADPAGGPYTYRAGRAEHFQYIADARERAEFVHGLTGLNCRAVEADDDRKTTAPTPADAPLLTFDDAYVNALADAFELDDDEAEVLAASVIGPPRWARTSRGTMRLVESVSRPLMDGTVNGEVGLG